MSANTLYERLGGYDGINHFVNDLLPRLQSDKLLSRFWSNRGEDGIAREKQLLIDFLSFYSGGPTYYTGRDMKLSHNGMKISEADWQSFLMHASVTMNSLSIPSKEKIEISNFVISLKNEIVEIA